MYKQIKQWTRNGVTHVHKYAYKKKLTIYGIIF